jgi:hypothetical protein
LDKFLLAKEIILGNISITKLNFIFYITLNTREPLKKERVFPILHCIDF